jgi:PPOX class probable FMN-dependent enzyme
MTAETQDALRARYGEPGDAAWHKAINRLDEHCAAILAVSPFAVVATSGSDGSCDASPRGGPPGFIRMLDETRVALGELHGNRLFETAQNLAENPTAALLVMVPGTNETLRIEGRAAFSSDDRLREATAIEGRLPWAALVIDVVTAYVHCGKAFQRSRLWDPSSWPRTEERPRMGAALAAHVSAPGPRSRRE